MKTNIAFKLGANLTEGDIVVLSDGRMFAVDTNPQHEEYENYAPVKTSPLEVWVTEVSYYDGDWSPVTDAESNQWNLGDGTSEYMIISS